MDLNEIIKKATDEFEKKLDEWCETPQHGQNCMANNEGSTCCIERPNEDAIYDIEGRPKLIELLNQAITLAVTTALEEVKERLPEKATERKLIETKKEGTHYVCDKRLKEEGGEAICCGCNPHEDCNLFIGRNKKEVYN